MIKRSPSPRRLAFLLTLPLLVLGGISVWALISENARVEEELRREARIIAKSTAEELNRDAVRTKMEALEVLIPQWQFNGEDPPPAGPLAEDYAAVLSSVRGGSGPPAEEVTKAKERLREAVKTGEVLTAVSPSGLPLLPLAVSVLGGAPDGSPAVTAAALRQPNELTEKMTALMAASAPEKKTQEYFRRRTERAMNLVALLKDRKNAPRGLPEWVEDWHVSGADKGIVHMTHLRDVAGLLEGDVPAGSLELNWKPSLPSATGISVGWNGKGVYRGSGAEMAVEQAGPWRVAITQLSSAWFDRESFHRIRWLGLALLGAGAVTGFSLLMAMRAFKKQQELTKLQSEFVASVSHELRTPVASIGVLAERLEEGKADAGQTTQYHRFIAREGRRLASLVNNVLDFSRIERGARQYDFEPTDLPSLVHETATLLRPAAEEKGLTLTEELQEVPEEQWPQVDAVAIRQALVNLLENAIKFTPSGGKVTVSFGASEGAVVLRVRDTGIGIPKSEHRKIFERFFRVDNGLRRETNGAGIGLSLVKHIAVSHRAKVLVESEVGKYSVFSLRFPKVPVPRQKKGTAS